MLSVGAGTIAARVSPWLDHTRGLGRRFKGAVAPPSYAPGFYYPKPLCPGRVFRRVHPLPFFLTLYP